MSRYLGRRAALCATAVGLSLCVIVPGVAFAADTIETVVVTARKKSEDVQKVPVAITAASGQDLIDKGIRQPSDLARIVPSLLMAQTASTSTGFITDIRGQVSSDIILNINQAVGLYEDGVNIPHPEGTNGAFFDLNRVEVLNGPQGTLYGRNTTGGAVNIYTKGADFDGYHGYVGAEYGNYNDWKINGAVNIPLVEDKLALRVAYQHWNRNGFGKSDITGEKLGGDHDDDTARASLLFTPTSDFTVDLRGEFINLNRNGDLITARGYDPNLDGAGGFQGALEAYLESNLDKSAGNPCAPYSCAAFGTFLTAPATAVGTGVGIMAASVGNAGNPFVQYENHDLFHSQAETVSSEHLKSWHADLTMTWDVTNNLQIKSITGYHQITDNHAVDLDATPFQIGEIGVGLGSFQPVVGSYPIGQPREEDDRFFSQELDFSGKSDDGRMSLLFGVFYSNDSGRGNQPSVSTPALLGITSSLCAFDTCRSPSFLVPSLAPYCTSSTPCFTNVANPNYVPEIIFGYDQKSVTDKSFAVFTQNDYKILDNLTFTFGGRYTVDDLAQNISTVAYDASPFGTTALPGLYTDPIAGQYICPLDNPSPISSTSTVCDVHQKARFTGFSYLLSLNWQITENTMAYAKTSLGYRAGVLQARAAGFPAAKPETAHDYELGLKSTFFDDRVQTNLDVYQTLYSNKQVTQVLPGPGVIPIPSTPVVNAASAKIKGFEGQITAIPIDGLTLGGTLTYLDGKYEKFLSAPLPEGGTIDASGFPFSEPKWRYSISARYDIPAFGNDLGFEADWAWHSHTPITALTYNPTFPALQKELNQAVGLLNARVDFVMPDAGWTVSLFSTNLLNKHYQVASLDAQAFSVGIPTGITQEPRMFGIQVKKTFGGE